MLTALAALVVLAAVIAGCGGGEDTTDSSTAALSKAQFIKQGDAICKKANEENEAEAEKFAKENGFELETARKIQLEELVEGVLIPSLEQQAEEIGALGAPEGDEERVEAIVVALEDAAGEIEDEPSLAFESKALEEPSKLAASYGFQVCGEV
ncbi:MAG TPA: hypothetical protein VF125_13035 [Solirubrobacterales bacterium]